MTTTLYRGIDYDISVVMGKVGIAGEFDIADVWYDWNQNSGFLDVGDRTTLSRLALTWTATVSVPLSAMGVGEGATGYTLMRVRMASTADGGNGACGDKVWGEVEDYVVIVEDLPCGDLDGDGDTDGEDIAALIAAYTAGDLSGIEYWQTADIDGDGMVTLADIVALVNAVYNGGDLICI
jgi:hypothetical protein